MRFIVITSLVGLGAWASIAQAQPTDARCKARVERMGKTLTAIPEYPVLLERKVALKLPEVPKPPKVEQPGFTLDYHQGWMAFEGKMLADIDVKAALEKQLAQIKAHEQQTRLMASPVYLRLDRNAKVKDVLPFMCIASRGRGLRLVVDGDATPPAYTPPPGPKSVQKIDAQLSKTTNPLKKTALLAKAFEDAVGDCNTLRRMFAALLSVPPSQRPGAMKRAVTIGLEECNCKSDVDLIEALAARILVPTAPRTYAVSMPLMCTDTPGQTWALSADTTVQALVERLTKEAPKGTLGLRLP